MLHMDIENHMALAEALEADGGSMSDEQARRAANAAAEHRLAALPALQARMDQDKEELAELENLGPEGYEAGRDPMMAALRPGLRLSGEEARRMQLSRLRAHIAAAERESKRLSLAMESLAGDPYYAILELKYYRKLSDMDIAERLSCDPTTIGRNRRRLVALIASFLYGL